MQCGSYGYKRKSGLCRACKNPGGTPVLWTAERLAYLIGHYATDGAQSVARALGLRHAQVLGQANKLGLRLDKRATATIVNAKARAYMLANNPVHRPESAEKMRAFYDGNPEARAARIGRLVAGQQALQRTKPSKLEARLRAMLDAFGVAHEPSALIKPHFVVDVRIGRLIIQADGDYWHGHPRYETLTARQHAQQRRDRAQDAYLTARGYAVERIWESELSAERLRAVLERHGIMRPLSPA